MARYIDAEELELEYYGLSIHGTMAVKSVLPIFAELLKKQPTADVVEVKHGYWKKRTTYPIGYNCSECNNSETYKSPFCRLCGTQMDGTPKERGGDNG